MNTEKIPDKKFSFENLIIIITGMFLIAFISNLLHIANNVNMTPLYAKNQIWDILFYYINCIVLIFILMNYKSILGKLKSKIGRNKLD